MSTNAAIGVKGTNTFHYVHWDGDTVGEELEVILQRDGAKALDVLLAEGRSWSAVVADPDYPERYHNFNFIKDPASVMGREEARRALFIQYVWEIDSETLEVKDIK